MHLTNATVYKVFNLMKTRNWQPLINLHSAKYQSKKYSSLKTLSSVALFRRLLSMRILNYNQFAVLHSPWHQLEAFWFLQASFKFKIQCLFCAKTCRLSKLIDLTFTISDNPQLIVSYSTNNSIRFPPIFEDVYEVAAVHFLTDDL